jgi:hypothetical protein
MRCYLSHFPSGTLRELIGETTFIEEMSTNFFAALVVSYWFNG